MKSTILEHFPLNLPPRPGQAQSIEFIQDMIVDGVQDIVIEAPTGAGKSAIGAAVCHWAGTLPLVNQGQFEIKPGGYYLVTQKALQEQIVDDVRVNFKSKDFASLKSSEAYDCEEHGNCQIGMMVDKSKACDGRKCGSCPYIIAKNAFERAHFSLTNYAYFLTERLFVGQLPQRQVLVCDECHTIEKTLLKFGELVFTSVMFKDWGLAPLKVPELDDMGQFLEWTEKRYMPIINDRLGALKSYIEADPSAIQNKQVKARVTALQNQLLRAKLAVTDARRNPDDWVYWCDQTERDGASVNLKPLQSAAYAQFLLSGAKHRIYLSAYPGDRELFCNCLGLDPETVAWIKLPSAFPVKNRPIVLGMVGSMSKRNIDITMPSFLRVVDNILTQHKDEKGIIHCNSYALGEKIYRHFSATPHGVRLLFPKNADERDTARAVHEKEKGIPTVIISPSMTEGFDFKDDLARWQVIAKMPYPYLGDLQVSRKKEQDPAWYALQTASTIIQACGRVVRSETDYGVTYILDSDFQMLWDRYKGRFFPPWFVKAMVWPKKK